MYSYQPPEEQDPAAIPTLEITDYDYPAQDPQEYANDNTPAPAHLRPPSKKSLGKRRQNEVPQSESDTERDTPDMSSQSSKQPSSSKRHSSSSKSKSKSKSKTKTDDWTEVTEPEERRRIQNRIAQRKFREKAREQKEQAQRDQQNQENATNTYRVPEPEDLGVDADVSGLPWGGLNMQYIVARGHESASQQGSWHASDKRANDLTQYANTYGDGHGHGHGHGHGQAASFDGRDSSGDDALCYDESPYFYDYENNTPGDDHGFGPTS